MTAWIALIVLGGIGLLILMWIVGIYNRLVTLKNRFQNAFAQIEVQLKRRYDLIPNLVETAKGYMAHERETLEAVICRQQPGPGRPEGRVRRNPGGADAMKQLAGAEGALAGALGRLSVVVERVSRPEGQPEHDAAQRRADLDGEQGGFLAPGFQRFRHRLQHVQADVPAGLLRRDARPRSRRLAARVRGPCDQIQQAPKVSFTS